MSQEGFNKYGEARLTNTAFWLEHMPDVITFCFLVLKCLQQFFCSSYKKLGLPSIIIVTKHSQYDGTWWALFLGGLSSHLNHLIA